MATTLAESDVAEVARRLGIVSELQAILQHTNALFGSQVRVEVLEDPEIPGEIHMVFCVLATGTIDEILLKETRWHQDLIALAGTALRFFRLSIDVD